MICQVQFKFAEPYGWNHIFREGRGNYKRTRKYD